MRAVLTNCDTRLLITGQSLSTLGDRAMFLVFAVWAKTLTGSNAAGGLAFLAIVAPTVLAPLGGVLVDRVPRRSLMLVTDAVLGSTVLLLVLVHSRDDVWLLYVVALVYGSGAAVSAAARSALLTVMVPDELLVDANGLLQTVAEGARLFAPLAGAALFAATGGGTVAVLDAATFAGSAFCLGLLSVREAPVRPTEHRLWQEFSAGVRHICSPGLLRRIVLVAAAAMLVIGFSETFVFAVLQDGLHKPPAFFGVLSTAQGLGAIGGGMTAGKVLRRIGDARLTGLGIGLFACGELTMIVAHLSVVLGGLVIAGLGLSWSIVGFATAVQRRTPAGLQGRVYTAADALLTAPQAISIAAGAALSTLIGYRVMIAALATVMGSCAVILLRSKTASGRYGDRPAEIGHRSHAEAAAS
jgi:MFS family permease